VCIRSQSNVTLQTDETTRRAILLGAVKKIFYLLTKMFCSIVGVVDVYFLVSERLRVAFEILKCLI